MSLAVSARALKLLIAARFLVVSKRRFHMVLTPTGITPIVLEFLKESRSGREEDGVLAEQQPMVAVNLIFFIAFLQISVDRWMKPILTHEVFHGFFLATLL